MAFGITDEDGNQLVIGLRDMASKSSDDTLSTLQDIMKDIEERFSQTNSNMSKELFVSITGTMSDCAATEVRFSHLLENYINEVVPLLKEARSEEMKEEDVSCSSGGEA